jgi:hypothetical protein
MCILKYNTKQRRIDNWEYYRVNNYFFFLCEPMIKSISEIHSALIVINTYQGDTV